MSEPPFFPGFRSFDMVIDGVSIHGVAGGTGPPLLLLHGAPQSHVMWRRIAPQLAQYFSVVATDLRGYGRSGKPSDGDYSKRRMALDQVKVMRELGHARFRLAGHDRGARVSRRLVKDHPDAVERVAIIDIVPTAHIFAHVDRPVAMNLWHWFFLSQPFPLPERLMAPQAGLFASASALPCGDEEAGRDYAETNGTAQAFHAMCEDYRAGAGIDIEHDEADASSLIECPTLVMWGEKSFSTAALFDVAAVWRNEATNVRFVSVDAGHYPAEEKPDETLAALLPFFRATDSDR